MSKSDYELEIEQEPSDLQTLGMGEVAFLRQITASELAEFLPEATDLEPDMKLWALLGADGAPIVVSDTKRAAEEDAFDRDMTIASVH